MKLLLTASTIAIALTMSAGTATAKTVVLKPINQNLETQACYVAATESMKAAKELVLASGVSFSEFRKTVTCNDMSLRDFANAYSQETEENSQDNNEKTTRIALVAKNANVESQLCLDAVTMGEQAARALHAINEPVACNGRDLSVFLRSFKNQQVEVRSIAD